MGGSSFINSLFMDLEGEVSLVMALEKELRDGETLREPDSPAPTLEDVFIPSPTLNCFPLDSDPEKHGNGYRRGHSLTASVSTSQTALDLEDGSPTTHEAGATPGQYDPNIVWWDGGDDPENPLNWSGGKRWGTVAIVSAITFITALASSMPAPGVPGMMEEFHSGNTEVAALIVSIYLLGLATGPLFLAPMSEMYGRLPLYHACNVLFVLATIGCAKSNGIGMLVCFRLLAGTAGSGSFTFGGGTIADLVHMQRRGRATSVMVTGLLMGPIVGPVAAGFLVQAKGWRSVFWVLVIIGAIISILTFVFMRETYALTLLERKAARLRKETGNPKLRSKLASPLAPRKLFVRSITRPTAMLIFSPIILALSIFQSIVYAYLYILYTTFPMVFGGKYGFGAGTIGLSYLGVGVGCLLGLCLFGFMSDSVMRRMTARNGDLPRAESRLLLMIVGVPLTPIGFFWYGWSAQANAHWIVPIVGTGLISCGGLATFMPIMAYLVDAFTQCAASALAANTVLRSMAAAFLPMVGGRLYEKLGLGWGNSLLGFIALACCPIPVIFYKYGERLRVKFDVSKY